jgi:spermidine/putrescine transport system permease protein
MAAPITVFVVAFGVIPVGTLLLYSFYTDGFYVVQHTLTTSNYAGLFQGDAGRVFWKSLARTLVLASLVTLTALAIAYPTAYYCARYLRRGRTFLFLLFVAPIFTSYLVKVYAWRGVLGEKGIINYGLIKLGIVSEPVGWILFNRFAVALALLSTALPFMFVSIYVAVERIPQNVLDAASDLGADSMTLFREILVPLTRRGVITGSTLSFIICLGDFIASQLLGGSSGVLVGKIVYSFFGLADNWPEGAARAFAVLIVACVVIFLFGVIARGGADEKDVVLDQQLSR